MAAPRPHPPNRNWSSVQMPGTTSRYQRSGLCVARRPRNSLACMGRWYENGSPGRGLASIGIDHDRERRDDRDRRPRSSTDACWSTADALPDALGWTLKPEGLCRDDTCVPVRDRDALFVGEQLDLAAVADALGRPIVVDADAGIVAVALDQEQRRAALESLTAPDVDARATSTARSTRCPTGAAGSACSTRSPRGAAAATTCPAGRRCTTSSATRTSP